MKIDLNIENRTTFKLPAKKVINAAILKTLKLKNIKSDVEVALIIVNKPDIQKLNNKYRRLNKPTDVLSFPILTKIPLRSSAPILLGDIVICPEMIEDNNFLDLVEHSTLHLIGYHHK